MVTLSRRQAVQTGSVLGAASLWPGVVMLRRPEPAVWPHAAGTTLAGTYQPTRPDPSGYRRLTTGPGWGAEVREELAGAKRGRADRRIGTATVVQVTDLHVMDVQHPLRFEYLDRINKTGHRPQELLTAQGTAALVQRINGLTGGPATGRPLDVVISTGDNTDNQAENELRTLLTILAGGTVNPASGEPGRFQGVANSGLREYWQPDSPAADRYKDRGFPFLPGLLDASLRPFESAGLRVPWLLGMGNHDVLASGMLATRGYVERWTAGRRKILSGGGDAALRLAALLADVPAGADAEALLDDVVRNAVTTEVTADRRRLPVTGRRYVELLNEVGYLGAGPTGHGPAPGADAAHLYFRYDVGDRVTLLCLDSTNGAGGIDGSIGAEQWEWLRAELTATASRRVLVFSHHPSDEMRNLALDPRTPGQRRYSGEAIRGLLHQHPQVLAWVNGHTHHHLLRPWKHDDPRRSFWEINTASHLDAPQQARVIEVVENFDGTVSLMTAAIDADSPPQAAPDDFTVAGLASRYRELSFNDPAFRDRRGRPADRNAELVLADPFG